MKLTKHGFTLTELMAVVIIIGILAGIGFGSYQKAIARSRFSEGLAAGASVQEAVNRYYYENTDIGLANAKDCASKSDYCVRTKYFQIFVNSDGSVTATHFKGTNANLYAIGWVPSFSGERRGEICTPINNGQEGQDFCKSMGYTVKSGPISFVKP